MILRKTKAHLSLVWQLLREVDYHDLNGLFELADIAIKHVDWAHNGVTYILEILGIFAEEFNVRLDGHAFIKLAEHLLECLAFLLF